MNKNLVILRCGRTSLHHHWLAGPAAPNWDLVLCPFEDIDPDPAATIIPSVKVKGQKWVGIFKLLMTWDGWRDYDYIWLPDDDLSTDGATINALFDLSKTFETKISAPALSEDSFFCHPTTMRNRNFFSRAVNFVEIMMPCLRCDMLELVLPTIGETRSGYGWGLDFLWPHMIQYQDIAIFDCLTIRHTRPVGAVRDPDILALAWQERQRVTATLGEAARFKTIGAYSAKQEFRPAHANGFLHDYLDGYFYLIEKQPQHMPWLVAQQRAQTPFRETYFGDADRTGSPLVSV